MDVRGAFVDRVEQNLLDEAHHRCVVDLDLGVVAGGGVLFWRHFTVEVEVNRRDRFQGLLDGFRQLVDEGGELVGLDDDRVHGQTGLKAYFVDGAQVRRIGDRHRQPVAALLQRQHAVGAHQLLVDRVCRELVRVVLREVQQRIAEGFRGKGGCVAGTHLAAGDQLRDETVAGLRALTRQALCFGLGQPPALRQRAGKTRQCILSGGGHGALGGICERC